MSHAIDRRRFLAALGRAGLGSAALATLPPWARATLAAAPHPPGEIPGVTDNPDIIVRNEWPEHWETSIAALGRDSITSNELFFVRSHFLVPDVDPNDWRLEIAGLVATPVTLTLAELRAMPAATTAVTLECAGNGRGLYPLASTSGTQWEYGAVGTARWSGVSLAGLLQRAGVKPETKHVWLEAADAAPAYDVPRFLRSIPLDKAMSDVMLAHTMNGSPLPQLHGFPLRAVVPGWYGMASTKWLTRIRLEDKPSDNHFMAKGYRYAYPGEDPAQAKPVEELRVKSLITRPLHGARVAPGKLRVQGFAWAAKGIESVEISIDGGTTWRAAQLVGEAQPAAWRTWTAELDARSRGPITLLARATDGGGEAQPLGARPNASGYGNNSIQRVTVYVAS